jgi:hypothetical protein
MAMHQHDEKPDTKRQPCRHCDRQRSHLAPGAAAQLRNGKRRRRHQIHQQDGDRCDARIVDRRDERHVDHRAAEAGEAACDAGQRGDRHRRVDAGLGERGRESFTGGEIDHIWCSGVPL